MILKALKMTTFSALTTLALIGCADDSTTTDTGSVSSSVMTSSSSGVATLKTITQNVVDGADFSTLEAAVIAAKLDDDLAGAGPFTVFAPTNAAFAKLPAGTIDALLKDPEGQLKNILLYHVVSGKVAATDVVKLSAAKTLFGDDVKIEVVDGKVILNGTTQVTSTDIMASNGIIHVIDAVLLPPEPVKALKTITQNVVDGADFSTLEAAVIAAKLDDDLAGAGPFTVFAPTNAAFAKLPAGTVETLLKDPEGQLKDILLYHVVSGKVAASDVVKLNAANTLFGKDVKIEVVNGKVILNGTTQVTTTDIMASNGIIHVIDAVLLPPEPVKALKTITQNVVDGADFSTLEAAVIAAKLDDDLAGAGPFTVFAPTDAAFAKLPAGTVETLLKTPEGQLKDILLYHVVSGKVPASDVVKLTAAKTLFGQDVKIAIVDGKVILNGTTQVTATDIMASNGIIHVIDAVLLPATK
jgi:uncharacterized surface protein with fasciclin (FAS1) repeats